MVKNGHQQQPARRNTELRREAYRLVAPGAAAIAGHLMRVFGIGAGGELALLLAPKAPYCNATAMRYWVSTQFADIASHPVEGPLLVMLEKRLLKTLQTAFPEAAGEIEVPSRAALSSTLPLPRWEPTGLCQPLKASRRYMKSARHTPSHYPLPESIVNKEETHD